MRPNRLLRIIHLTCFASGLALASVAVASAETAHDLTRSRSLAMEGLEAWDRRDLPTAFDRLNQAYQLHPLPTLAWWSGCVLEQMGRLVEASERWRDASGLTFVATGKEHEAQLQAQQDAATAYAAMLRRIPKLVIKVEGGVPADARLSVDGSNVPIDVIGTARPLDPGDHEVQLSWADRSVTERVRLVEGRAATVELSTGGTPIQPAAVEGQPVQAGTLAASIPVRWDYSQYERTPSRQSILGWAVIGVGAVGLATWGITGAIALDRHDRLQDHCKQNTCSSAYQQDLDQFRRYRTGSAVAFVAGVVGVAAGVTLVLTAPRRSPDSSTALNWHGWVGPSSIGVEASY